MNRVPRPWPNHVPQLNPLLPHRRLHDVCGLFLVVELAGVGDDGALPQVGGPAGAVVPLPELPLPPGRLEVLFLEDLEEVGGFAEPRAGVGGEPAIGIVDGEMPGGGPAHREATDANPVLVHAVAALDG